MKQIKHDDSNVSKKVSFFYNYFYLANNHLGKIPRFRFNSPSYVVDSILYQIQFNKNKSISYIDNLIKSLSAKDFELLKLASPKSEKTKILNNILDVSCKKKLKDFIFTNTSNKVRQLESVQDELKKNEIQTIVAELTNYLSCKHKLITHKVDLEYLAVTLVSIYRFKGYSKSKSKEKLDSILSKNIYVFPFPKSILEIFNKNDQLIARERFLETINLKQQIKGIKNGLDEKTHSLNIIFKISNINLDNDVSVDFTFNEARVIDPNHQLALKIKSNLSENSHFYDFFNVDNILICIIKFNTASSTMDHLDSIYEKLQKVVNYINGRLGEIKVSADKSEYLTTFDYEKFGSGFSSKESKTVKIHDYSVRLLGDNASNYLNGINSTLKNLLLCTENLFWEAKNNGDLIKLWQYLENTTPFVENEVREVCKTVRNILLFRHKRICKSIYTNEIINIIANDGLKERNEFSKEVLDNVLKKKYDNINPWEATKYSDRYFVKSIGLNWKKDQSKATQQAFVDHWGNIIIEARAYRNMVLHNGEFNKLLKIKLEVTFPYLVFNYRFCCISLVKKHSECKDYYDLIFSKVKEKNK